MQVDRMISEIEEAYKGWKIGKRISTGSSGTVVYEINRNYGCKEENVIKIVTLLEERVCWEDMTEESRRNYETQRKKAKENTVQEVALMYDLKTCENIVGYLDYGFWKSLTRMVFPMCLRFVCLNIKTLILLQSQKFYRNPILLKLVWMCAMRWKPAKEKELCIEISSRAIFLCRG